MIFIRVHSRNSLTLFLLLIFSFFSCNGDPEEDPQTWEEAPPLHGIYFGDFLMGNIISPSDLSDTIRFSYLKRHFNTVTAENDMKPDYIAPASKGGAYRFTDADKIVNEARAAGMKVVGHTLIWHEQTPSWLTTGTQAEVLSNLEKYVTDVVEHFEGKLSSWDVVNEAMMWDNWESGSASNWKSCLRPLGENKWMIIGPEYIEKAFLAARNADPEVMLYYNDVNLNRAYKAQAVYNMVNEINTRYPDVKGRQLIDGIGMQTHHHLSTNPETVRASIELFAELGVEIAISEMDIQAAGDLPEGTVIWGDDAAKRQAALYATLFALFKVHRSNISRVTFWGIDDGTSWLSSTYPTLLDKDYNLKPAFYAVMHPDRY